MNSQNIFSMLRLCLHIAITIATLHPFSLLPVTHAGKHQCIFKELCGYTTHFWPHMWLHTQAHFDTCECGECNKKGSSANIRVHLQRNHSKIKKSKKYLLYNKKNSEQWEKVNRHIFRGGDPISREKMQGLLGINITNVTFKKLTQQQKSLLRNMAVSHVESYQNKSLQKCIIDTTQQLNSISSNTQSTPTIICENSSSAHMPYEQFTTYIGTLDTIPHVTLIEQTRNNDAIHEDIKRILSSQQAPLRNYHEFYQNF